MSDFLSSAEAFLGFLNDAIPELQLAGDQFEEPMHAVIFDSLVVLELILLLEDSLGIRFQADQVDGSRSLADIHAWCLRLHRS